MAVRKQSVATDRPNVRENTLAEREIPHKPNGSRLGLDDLDSLEETLDLLTDQAAIRELVEAQAAIASGDVVRGVDAVRALQPPSTR